MDEEIKKIADSRDLKSLKYIFVDSLDVDPTFVRYEKEYDYCMSIPGVLETHQELTPFNDSKTAWNEAYWTALKMDLIKNFSDKRMTHMRKVAKVLLAEKIKRILDERATAAGETTMSETVNPTTRAVTNTTVTSSQEKPEVSTKPRLSKAEEQDIEIQKRKERLAKELKTEEKRIQAEKACRAQQRDQSQNFGSNAPSGADSKKSQGVAVAAVMVIVVAAIVVAAKLLLK